jgi:heme a synthase
MLESPLIGRPATLARWLFFVALLVFGMVVVGGITRLTESGLSITQWKPITGAIPPLSQVDWQAAFDAYKRIPEYAAVNHGMSLSDFKFIYFWEFVHRLLARVVGIAFAAPYLWFAIQRAVPKGYGWRLTALFALGGFQGAIGWWMVKSGLTLRTDVSHFRLAAHLITALTILSGLVWTALDLRALASDPRAQPARLTGFSAAVLMVLLIQLVWGAFMAGLNAGSVASSWPLMNDRFFPLGVQWLPSTFATMINDPFLIHFLHRWWALATIFALVLLARRAKFGGSRAASIAVHLSLGIQILLGIATVMSGINIALAVLHQAVGACVVASAIWGAHVIGVRRVTAATMPSD